MKSLLKNAVFYEIYPQSFLDTNNDGIGDFEGIIRKLDYIKDIGFTAIWMNPCFDSPFADAGYDVRDYYKTAERYGSNEDLKRLFDAAHERGLSVILDLVPGHTSVECEWFKKSMQAQKNEYTDRYVWTDCIWTDFGDTKGITGSIRGISKRDGCAAVNFFSTQPCLNYGFAKVTKPWQKSVNSEAAISTRNELLNIIRFWLKLGCDGFRVDMAGSLVKDDEEQIETIKLWSQLLGQIKTEFPNAVFVSEWGEPERALRGGYDMDFLLHFGPSHYTDMYHSENPYFSTSGKGKAKEFFKYYIDCHKQTKEGGGFICLPSGNHDIPRLSYYCSPTHMKLVYAFMMSMPGVPFIYYGDEIGMKYLPNVTSVEGGYNRTGARTPMQWDDSKNAGFSSADKEKLYIMQDESADKPTVKAQLQDENSILNELKKLIAIRRKNEVLAESADFELINDDIPLVYKRKLNGKTVLVAINTQETAVTIDGVDFKTNGALYTFGEKAEITNGKLTVPPLSASFLI